MEQLDRKVVHINSYFFSNALHYQLVKKIAKTPLQQVVYIPLNTNDVFEEPLPINGVRFFIGRCFNAISRKLWPIKIIEIYKFVRRSLKKEEIKVIHAHSLFVNGFVAYLLYRKWKIKYIVTIRNTDINLFMKSSFLFRKLGFEIMKHADTVCTLSHSYFDIHLKKNYKPNQFRYLKSKHHVIPNGAEDVWFENSFFKDEVSDVFQIVFVGLIADNKNLKNVIAACKLLKSKNLRFKLKVVGSGRLETFFKNQKYDFDIEFLGYIQDRKKLIEIYRNSDVLCVPSFTESFGLVYVEAMSQSLPVIYTKDQGFDGFFPNGEVGYAVDPNVPEEIADALIKVKENYATLSKGAYENAFKFQWNETVEKLNSLYKKFI